MKVSRLDALVMEQEGISKLGRAEIEAVQLEKLNSLLVKERERAGFYAGLPGRLECLEQLKTLPFTTDEDLAANPGGLLLISQSMIQRVLSDATSGTTGRAKRVFYTRDDCENTVRLFMAGLGELIFPGCATMVCMPFSGPYGLGELICQAVERLGARPIKAGVGLCYGELSRLLDTEKPDTYVGTTTGLLSLLRFCGKKGLSRALVSGDACPDAVLRRSEEILGTRLFPHYGSREMGLGGAVTCPAHEGMHLRENHVIAEIIDPSGRPLPKGEYGELVISTIGMEAMPLIRYRTGDYTRILPEPCPCGSELVRLDSLSRGAWDEMLRLDDALFDMEEIVDFMARRIGRKTDIELLYNRPPSETRVAAAVEKVFPGEEIPLQMRAAQSDDRPLYPGKRRL